jgi:hypothetical protein
MTKTSRIARNMAGGPIALSYVYKSEVPLEYHTVSVRELYRISFHDYWMGRTSVSQVIIKHARLIT